jgi:hypothetical protein
MKVQQPVRQEFGAKLHFSVVREFSRVDNQVRNLLHANGAVCPTAIA